MPVPRSAPGIPRSLRFAAPLRWSEGGLLVVAALLGSCLRGNDGARARLRPGHPPLAALRRPLTLKRRGLVGGRRTFRFLPARE